jgi:hypothetical protein
LWLFERTNHDRAELIGLSAGLKAYSSLLVIFATQDANSPHDL